jgi:cell division protein FtsA
LSNFYSCVENEEAENGVTIIDLGEATTSYLLVKDNIFYDFGCIPLGGGSITNDIVKVLNTSHLVAERIKILHSGVGKNFIDSHKVIDVPIIANREYDTKELESITLSSLSEVVTCRAEEIVEILKGHIANKFSSEFTCRIVLTGGGSQLLGMKELIAKNFGAKVRMAKPYAPEDYVRGNKDLFFSSAIGAARGYVLKNKLKKLKYDTQKATSLSDKIYKWLGENI